MSDPTEQEMDCELDVRIEDAITDGIWKGQSEISRRRKHLRRRFTGVIVATIILFSCLFSIKVSPVFAAMVRDIPGLENFVDLINNTSDKGIKLALDNDFIQPVGVSDEHEDMKFTVQGVIVDDSRMVVFYDIQLPDTDSLVQFDGLTLSDISGQRLPAVVSFNYPEEAKQDIQEEGIQRGTIDFELSHGTTFPSEVVLKVLLKNSVSPNTSNVSWDMIAGNEAIPAAGLVNVGGAEFNVIISIDREKFAGLKHEYTIGETIQIEGQSISFTKAIISPLSVSLYLDYKDDNSMQIFGPGDIQLVDDEGTIWRNTSGSTGKEHQVYHFESPYFKEPKSLTIEGSWFRALDKNQLSVVMDTEKGQLLHAPDGKLNFYKMTNIDNYMKLDFALNVLNPEDHMMYSLFEGEFTDAEGNRYKTADLQEIISGYIENNTYKQPLTLTIYDYPAYIRKPYKISIK